jgi:hypothetical protein
VCAAAAVWAAAPAYADSFGELGHFGAPGTAKGQLSLSEETEAFGVDPTDNSIYIVDHPYVTNNFRLQKFVANSEGVYTAVASVRFQPKAGVTGEIVTIEGVAIDPAMHRAYVLAVEERNFRERKVDSGMEAASEIYAFSTVPSGEQLPPASGTGAEGLAVTQKVLKAQNNKYGQAILEPSGIAVEPVSATQDKVVVLGTIDNGAKDEHQQPIMHNEMEWFNNEGVETRKFIDEPDVLEDEAISPVVYGGKTYVQTPEGIFEPRTIFGTNRVAPSGPEETFLENQGLWVSPEFNAPFYGAGLSVAPDGTFWSTASVRNAAAGGFFYPGAVAFSHSGAYVGWIGGGAPGVNGGRCAIGFWNSSLIAAGSGGKVFMFYPNPAAPRVVIFGPGGEGCPGASVSSPEAAVAGQPLQEGATVTPGTAVSFSSHVTEANAMSVEWSFGDGATWTDSEPEAPTTHAEHTYAAPGEYQVTETVHTDDLATPTVTATRELTVAEAPPPEEEGP